MPLNAATEAARLSTAPMMGGSDFGLISVGCEMSCALCVQLEIAFWRALSGIWRLRLTGELLSADTFFVSSLKGVGKVYLHAVFGNFGPHGFRFLRGSGQFEALWRSSTMMFCGFAATSTFR
jgi:hypothetical protein